MTFVGTRPESVYYARHYTPEMFATLLLPAGVTSEASIRYKDEAEFHNPWADLQLILCDADLIKPTWKILATSIGVF